MTAAYDRIEVQWPGGERRYSPAAPANRIVLLEQGKGSVQAR